MSEGIFECIPETNNLEVSPIEFFPLKIVSFYGVRYFHLCQQYR